jgi:hypothetical protein
LSKLVAALCLVCAVHWAGGAVMAGEDRPVMGVCVMGMRHPYFRDMLDELQTLLGA